MASRTYNFIRGLGAGYLAIAVNILYTAASVPLALHYLGKEQFGLWALAQQIMGYLMLLDLGVSSAVSRFIADCKDDVNSGGYGSVLITGAIVFAIQGILIAIVGVAFSFFAPALFAVPDHLASDFTNVLIIITSLAGLSVAFRSLGAPLWAFQRTDIGNLAASFSLITGFAMLWAGLHSGWGIYALAFSSIPALAASNLFIFVFSKKSGYYPKSLQAGSLDWILCRRIFSFGVDVLQLTLGSQLVNATHLIILSRFCGLNSAAIFSIGTKTYNLVVQLVYKTVESASPGLTEIYIRNDLHLFSRRLLEVIEITLFQASIFATTFLLFNSSFVSLWTSGVISWHFSYDIPLAFLILLTALTRWLIGSFGMIGNYRPVRHIYLFEGVFFILIAPLAAISFGISGVLVLSLVSHICITIFLSGLMFSRRFSLVSFRRPFFWALFLVSLASFLSFLLSRYFPTTIDPTVTKFFVLGLTTLVAWRTIFDKASRLSVFSRFHSKPS